MFNVFFFVSLLVMKGTSTYEKGVTRLEALTTQTVITLHGSSVPNESARKWNRTVQNFHTLLFQNVSGSAGPI